MSRTPTFALGTIRSYTRREGNSTTYTRNAVYTLYRKFSRSKKIGLETFLRLKKKRYYHTRHVFENRKKVLNGTLKKKKREKKNYFKSFETRFQNIFQDCYNQKLYISFYVSSTQCILSFNLFYCYNHCAHCSKKNSVQKD